MPRLTIDGETFVIPDSVLFSLGKEGNRWATRLNERVEDELVPRLDDLEEPEEGIVVPEGLVGDGVTDDSDAIQDAYDSLEENETLRIPAGTYSLHKPILLNKSAVTFSGSGRGNTFFQVPTNQGGTGLFLWGPDEDPIPTATIGGVVCMDFTVLRASLGTPGNAWLNLRDSYQMEWNGEASRCWEFRFRTGTLNVGTEEAILTACGKRFTTTGVENFFQFYTTIDKELRVVVNISGTQRTLFSTTVLEDDTDYEVRIDYDGTTLGMMINGVVDVSGSWAGTLTLARHANICLGPSFPGWPYGMGMQLNAAPIYLRSFRCSQSRGLTPYVAAPTSLYAADNSTHLLLNFGETYGPCTVGYGYQGEWKYYLQAIRPTQGTEVVGTFLRDFAVSAGAFGAIHSFRARRSTLERIVVHNGRYGLCHRDNSYNSLTRDLSVTNGQAHPFFAVMNGYACGPNHYENLEITGVTYGFVNLTGSVTIAGSSYINGPKNCCFYSRSDTVFDAVQLFSVAMADEGSASAPEATVMLDGPASCIFNGCSFDAPTFDISPFVIDSKNYVQVNGGMMQVNNGGTAPLVEVVGGDAQGELRFSGVQIVNQGAHPRASEAGHVIFDTDYRSGVATVSDTDDFFAIDFGDEGYEDMPDDTYVVQVTVAGKTGTPAAGSNLLDDIDQDETGFTVTLAAAPDTGNTRSFNWSVSPRS